MIDCLSGDDKTVRLLQREEALALRATDGHLVNITRGIFSGSALMHLIEDELLRRQVLIASRRFPLARYQLSRSVEHHAGVSTCHQGVVSR